MELSTIHPRALQVVLPFPPSVNAYWRTPRRGQLAGMTLLSAEARAFRTAAVAAIGRQVGAPLSGRLAVTLTLSPPDRRRRDIDNYSKGVLDALTHARLWEDDEQVDRLLVVRGAVGKPGRALVVIEELETPE